MKNKKGFTLVELLAVIIILGVISTVIIFAVTSLINKAKLNYYKTMGNNLLAAGQDYYTTTKSARPKRLGYVASISLSDLVSENYFKEAKTYDGKNTCSGFVKSWRNSDGKYQYKACLDCGTEYQDSNCNDSDYEIIHEDEVYVYLDDPVSSNFVVTYPNRTESSMIPTKNSKYSSLSNGTLVNANDKTVVDGVSVISPLAKVLDTSKISNNQFIQYKYQYETLDGNGDTQTRDIIASTKVKVYQNKAPVINFANNYVSGNWSKESITGTISHENVREGFQKYQASTTGVYWYDLQSSTISKSSETNGSSASYRYLDNKDHPSLSTNITYRIDKHAPTVSVVGDVSDPSISQDGKEYYESDLNITVTDLNSKIKDIFFMNANQYNTYSATGGNSGARQVIYHKSTSQTISEKTFYLRVGYNYLAGAGHNFMNPNPTSQNIRTLNISVLDQYANYGTLSFYFVIEDIAGNQSLYLLTYIYSRYPLYENADGYSRFSILTANGTAACSGVAKSDKVLQSNETGSMTNSICFGSCNLSAVEDANTEGNVSSAAITFNYSLLNKQDALKQIYSLPTTSSCFVPTQCEKNIKNNHPNSFAGYYYELRTIWNRVSY